jgi:hypothetical protein
MRNTSLRMRRLVDTRRCRRTDQKVIKRSKSFISVAPPQFMVVVSRLLYASRKIFTGTALLLYT